jgi:peptidoglycan/LPS O-acetylase OafA/YrhL
VKPQYESPLTRDPPHPVEQYRGDIDGLRAISIIAVVLYHAGVDATAGGYVGVDVFFVISGFLITGLLAREVAKTGRVSLRDFYARRIRRLLPLSATTLLVTLLSGLWLLPPTARQALVDDVRAASLYVANWRYATQATAYSDTEVTDSLLVHYWSLAIEEQFYVIWPLVIALGAAIARLTRRPNGQTSGVLLGIVGVASFAASVIITDREGIGAYYLTHTRLWELAAGAGLALTIHRVPQLSRGTRDLIAAIGLGAIAVAIFTYDEATSFPGTAALLPVFGSLTVLLAGAQGLTHVGRAIGAPPLRLLGRLSYAWYLLHWPAIGVGLLLRDRYEWTVGPGVVTAGSIVVSLVLAWFAHHAIENPVRFAGRLKRGYLPTLSLGLGLTLLPLVVGAVMLSVVDNGNREVVFEGPDGEFALTQTPAAAATDEVQLDSVCHAHTNDVEPAPNCVFGDPTGDRTIVLLGDSHARQWLDVLDLVGREEGWKIYAWTKSACSIIDNTVELTVQARAYSECDDWRAAVTQSVVDLGGVDHVLLARANYTEKLMINDGLVSSADAPAVWDDAINRTVASFANTSDDIILLSDTPWPGFAAPNCLSAVGATLDGCSFSAVASRRDATLTAVEQAAAETLAFRPIDPFPLVCDLDVCSTVTSDGLIKYRDSHHLTRTFSLTLADEVKSWFNSV